MTGLWFSWKGNSGSWLTVSISIQTLIRDFLERVSRPLWRMIWGWALEGVLEDPYHEFFVGATPGVGADLLWHEKYAVRSAMIPSFLPDKLVNRILLLGKVCVPRWLWCLSTCVCRGCYLAIDLLLTCPSLYSSPPPKHGHTHTQTHTTGAQLFAPLLRRHAVGS